MPCFECQNRDSAIFELRATLEERDQQLSDVNAKLSKQKLHSKAKWAQLRHQLMENITENEGPFSQKVVENLMCKLEEAENQLLSCRDEIDVLKTSVTKTEAELTDKNEEIRALEKSLEESRENSNRTPTQSHVHSEATSDEDDEDYDLRERARKMYAQIVYKDSKIVDLNEMVLHRDQKILDLQESCRERDEVIWAKTKAIQVFQEKLNFYANRELRDVAIQATVHGDTDSNTVAGPGRAVAFYGESARMDEDRSSVTTEFRVDAASIMEKFKELAESVRSESVDASSSVPPVLHARLAQALQQMESLRDRLDTLETSNRDQQNEPKKKKKVTFDFTLEQERAQEFATLNEQLRQAEQACMDLKEENDDLRLTIADLEREFHSRDTYSVSEEQLESLKADLSEKEQEAREAEEKAQALYSSRLHQLEQQLDEWQQKYFSKEAENHNAVISLQDRLNEAELENIKLSKQKEFILSDVDDLREAIETSQQLITGLENDLQAATSDLESTRSTLDTQRREHAQTVASLERELRDQKLSAKAYQTKLHNVQMESQRLSELLEAQQREWIALKAGGKEVTGARLKAKAYEAKFRILQDDNKRLEGLVDDLKGTVDSMSNEKAELTRDYEQKLTVFEEEARENLALIEQAMAEQKVQLEAVKAEFNSETRLKTKAYEAKWKSIERENERLTDSVQELKAANQQLEEGKQQLLDKISILEGNAGERTQLENELQQTKDELESMERTGADLQTNLDHLRSALDTKNTEYESAMEEIAQAQSSVAALHSQLDSTKSALDQAREQLQILSSEKQDLESDVQRLWDVEAKLKRRMGELETMNGRLNEEIESLTQRCSSADVQERKLFELSEAHEVFRQNYTKMMEKMEFLETTSSSESTLLAEEREQWKETMEKIRMALEEKQNELNLVQGRENDLKRDNARLEGERREAEARLAYEAEEKRALRNALEELRRENDGLQTRLNDASAVSAMQMAAVEESLEEMNERWESLSGEASSLRLAKASLEDQVRILQDQRQEVIRQKETMENRLRDATVLNESLMKELNTLREEASRTVSNDAPEAIPIGPNGGPGCSNGVHGSDTVDRSVDPEVVTSQLDEIVTQNERLRSEALEYKERCAFLALDMENLKAKLDAAEADRAAYTEKLERRETELLEKDRRMLEKDRIISGMDQTISEKDQTISEKDQTNLEKDQSIATIENNELKNELDGLLLQNNTLQTELDHLRSENNGLQKKLAELTSDNDGNLQELHRLTDSITSMETERKKLAEERHSLCQEIVALNERLSSADAMLQALKSNFETLVEENEELKLATLKERDDGNMELIVQLEKQNREAQEGYQQMVIYYNDLQSAYATVRRQYEEAQKRPIMTDVETGMDSEYQIQSKPSLRALDAGVNTETAMRDGQRESPDQGRPEMIKMKAKLRKMEKTMEAMEAKNRYLQEENSSLSNSLAELESRMGSLASANTRIENTEKPEMSNDMEEIILSGPDDDGSIARFEIDEPLSDPAPRIPTMVDDETERRIATAMAEARGFQQHVSVLVDQLNSSKDECSQVQDRLEKMEFERSRLQNQLNDANETIQFLTRELDGVKHLFQNMDTEKEDLKRRVLELSSQESELKTVLAERSQASASIQHAAVESSEAIKGEIDELRTSNDSMKEQLEEAINERDRAREKVRRLLTANDELEASNRDSVERISDYESRLSELELLPGIREENNQMKSRLELLSSTLEHWEKQAGELEGKAGHLSMENEQLGKEKEGAVRNLEVARNNLLIVQRELAQVNEDNNLLRSIMEELEGKNGQLQEEIDSWTSKCRELEPLQEIIVYSKELEQRFHQEMEKREAIEHESQVLEEKLNATVHELNETRRLLEENMKNHAEARTLLEENSAREIDSNRRLLEELEWNQQKLLNEIQELVKEKQELVKEKEELFTTMKRFEDTKVVLESQMEEMKKETALNVQRLRMLERDVETLTSSLETSNADLISSREREETSNRRIYSLEGEIKQLQQRIEAVGTNEETVHQLRNSLETMSMEMETKIQQLAMENEELRTAKKLVEENLRQRVNADRDSADAEGNYQALMKKNEEVLMGMEVLRKEMEGLVQENERLQGMNEESLKEIEELVRKTEELEGENGELSNKKEELLKEKEELIKEKEELIKEKEELIKEKEELIKEKEELLKEKEDLLEAAKRFERTNAGLENRLEEITNENGSNIQRLRMLENDCGTLKNSLESVNAASRDTEEASENRIQSLQEELQCLQMKAETAEKDAIAAVSAARSSEEMVSDLRNSLSTSNDELIKAQSDCELVRTMYANIYSAYGQLEMANKEMAGELATVKAMIETKEKNESALLASLDDLKLVLEKTKEEANVARVEEEEMRNQVAHFEEEMKRKEEALEAARSEVSELEALKLELHELEALHLQVRELEQLRLQVQELESLRSEVQELEDLKLQVQDLETLKLEAQELESIRSKVHDLEAANRQLQVELTAKSNALESLQHLQLECQDLENANSELQSELAAKRDALESLQTIRLENHDLKTTNHQLRAEVTSKCEDLQHIQVEIQKLENANRHLNSEILDRNGHILALEKEKQELLEEVDRKKEEVLKLGSQESSTEKETQTQIRRLRETLIELERHVTLSNEKNAVLEREAIDWRQKCDHLETEIGLERQKCLDLERGIAMEREKSSGLEQRMEAMSKKWKDLELERDQLMSSSKEMEELKRKLSTLQSEYESLESAMEKVQHLEKEKERKLEILQSHLRELEEDKEKESDDLRKQFQQSEEKKMEELSGRFQDLVSEKERELENLRQRLHSLTTETTSLREENDDFRARHVSISDILKQKEANFVQLNERYTNLLQETQQVRLESEARQRQAAETVSKESEYRDELSRLQLQYSSEIIRLKEEVSRCELEKRDALQWLEKERPKYTGALRELGELKEDLAQKERQLESLYLKLAEVDVMKETIRELERGKERLKAEKKELTITGERLNQEKEEILRRLEKEEEMRKQERKRAQEEMQKSEVKVREDLDERFQKEVEKKVQEEVQRGQEETQRRIQVEVQKRVQEEVQRLQAAVQRDQDEAQRDQEEAQRRLQEEAQRRLQEEAQWRMQVLQRKMQEEMEIRFQDELQRRIQEETVRVQRMQTASGGSTISVDALRQEISTLEMENEQLRADLQSSEHRSSYLMAQFRECQENWSRKSHLPSESFVDLEANEIGDTISLMPVTATSSDGDEGINLQLRREVLGSLSATDRSVLRSTRLWLKSKMRKYPYLSRRRPGLFKVLLVAYVIFVHTFLFLCWLHH